MNSINKISQAKSKLMLEYPYFGTIASSLDIEIDNSIQSYKNINNKLLYNSQYIDSVDIEDIEFILASTTLHKVLNHQNRNQRNSSKLWQLASEYVINSMLVNNGMELPIMANYQDRFNKMYVEEVYTILESEMSDEYEEQESQDIVEDLSQDEEFFQQLIQKLEKTDSLPKDLEYIIPSKSKHINWRDELYRYIASYDKSLYQFFPPNMKYLYQGIYLPSLHSDLLNITIAIDTSASIDEDLLSIFLSQIEEIMLQYPNYKIDLIQVDDKIQSHQIFLNGDKIDYSIKGRGATDFRVLFEYIDKNLDTPTLLIYFSDGDGIYPSTIPTYDTIWVSEKKIEKVPFGDNIIIKNS